MNRKPSERTFSNAGFVKVAAIGGAAVVSFTMLASPSLATPNLEDWAGVYTRVGNFVGSPTYDPNLPAGIDPNLPEAERGNSGRPALPYKPQFEARLIKPILDAIAADKPVASPGAVCRPTGLVNMMQPVFPIEVIPSRDELIIIAEDFTQLRRIYLNGHAPPPPPFPTYNGYSIGHWEGDVLVVKTTGLRSDMPYGRLPLGPNAQVAERMYMKSGELLDEMTITAPSLMRPYTAVRHFIRNSHVELFDYVCENSRNPVDKNGLAGVQLQSDGAAKTVYLPK